MKAIRIISLVAIFLFCLAPALFGAGGGSGGTSLGQNWDFGDVRGSFSTYGGDTTSPQMSASLSLSSGVITSCYISVFHEKYMDQPGKTYFEVYENFGGNYDTLPTLATDLNQNFSGAHHGASIYEYSGLYSYKEWQNGDTTVPTGIIWDSANSAVTLAPFVVTSAHGDFSEYSWTDKYAGLSHNEFNYSVMWLGYTTTPAAAEMFSSIQSASLTTVPEPSIFCLLSTILAFGGSVYLRRKR
jgi:hypothetical protein